MADLVTVTIDERTVQVAKGTEPAGFRSDEIRSLSHKTKG